MGRNARWLILLPAFFYAFFPVPAHAEPQPGLNAVGYYIDEIPPLQSDTEYPTCGSEIENNINRNFNGEPFQDCGWDMFMVHYTGFIEIPEHDTIQMMVAADDGGTVEIDGQQFGTWNLKGCSWSRPITLSVMPGPQPLDGWFFEAGGGTCYMLAWKIDDGYWEIVPEWAFTTESIPPTTTTTTTVLETTVPATTTTSTTVPETSTTTTVQETTTTETTVTTTSTTEAPTTTTTEAPAPATSQAPPPSVDTTPPATLATPVVVTQAPSTTTAPETTLPPVSSTEAPPPLTTAPTVPVTQTSRPPATTLAPASTLPPETPQSSLVSATPETVTTTPQIVIEPSSVSPEQAVAVALNPQVLATVSSDEAEAVFEALAVDELSDTQIDALVAAVQEAPTEVREAFEDKIDVFGEGFDNYVPLGSTIPVSARRTLIAAGAALAVAASSVRKR